MHSPVDERHHAIDRMHQRIADKGFESIRTLDYAGTHWLGTFAAYAIGRRSID